METRNVLRLAKEEIIDPERWSSRGWLRKDGKLCAVEAILEVTRRYGIGSTPAHHVLMDACGGSVMCFNDDPDTTHADVIAAFDKAILALTEQPVTPLVNGGEAQLG